MRADCDYPGCGWVGPERSGETQWAEVNDDLVTHLESVQHPAIPITGGDGVNSNAKVTSERACAFCIHFRPQQEHNGEIGECHRRAPAPFVWALSDPEELRPTVDVIWPDVFAEESCGEFEPGEAPPARTGRPA